jgi:hypothetical protein
MTWMLISLILPLLAIALLFPHIAPEHKGFVSAIFFLIYGLFVFLYLLGWRRVRDRLSRGAQTTKLKIFRVLVCLVFIVSNLIYLFLVSRIVLLTAFYGELHDKFEFDGYRDVIYVFDSGFVDPETSIKSRIPYTPYLKTISTFSMMPKYLEYAREDDRFIVRYGQREVCNMKLTGK